MGKEIFLHDSVNKFIGNQEVFGFFIGGKFPVDKVPTTFGVTEFGVFVYHRDWFNPENA